MSDATNTAGTRVSCPVCALAVKITRRGEYAPHGNRYNARGRGNGNDNLRGRCRGSWFPVEMSLADIARRLEEHAAEMDASAARCPEHDPERAFWTDAAERSRAARLRVLERAAPRLP